MDDFGVDDNVADMPEVDWGATEPGEPPPMYEPDQAPGGDDNSTQWAPYDNTGYIPPQDDFAPDPIGISEPPPGRQYAQYRQQPTWQHASLAGIDGTQVNMGGLLQGLAAIATASALGYALTRSPRVAAGSALGMAGVLQLPSLLSGQFIRALIGVAAAGGAFLILRDDLKVLGPGGLTPNWDDDGEDEDEDGDDDEDDDDGDDGNGGGRWESNGDGEEDEDEDEDDGGDEPPRGASDPASSSPWLEQD